MVNGQFSAQINFAIRIFSDNIGLASMQTQAYNNLCVFVNRDQY